MTSRGCLSLGARVPTAQAPCLPVSLSPCLLAETVRADDLVIFDHAVPAAYKGVLLHRTAGTHSPAFLICPSTWQPLSRALLLNLGSSPNADFLLEATTLCERLEVDPIVLTVAHSERVARRHQEEARAVLAEHGLTAYFDSMIGIDLRTAGLHVARWRQCQLMVMPLETSPAWRRWLGRSNGDWVVSAAECVCMLSLPSAAIIDGVTPRSPHPQPLSPASGGEGQG